MKHSLSYTCFPGDGVLADENVSLEASDLRDGSALSLELLKTEIESDVTIRFCKVIGNDRRPKFNPMQSGTRFEEKELSIKNNEKIFDIKLRMLADCWGSEVTDDVITNTRLRLTNWAGECGELLPEIDINGENITVAAAFKLNIFKAGDLLLLEEGKIPINGVREFKVSFHMVILCKLYHDFCPSLQIFLWHNENDTSLPQSSSNPESDIIEFVGLKESGVLVHPERAAKRNAMLSYIGDIETHEDSLLSEFYESCYTLVQEHFATNQLSTSCT